MLKQAQLFDIPRLQQVLEYWAEFAFTYKLRIAIETYGPKLPRAVESEILAFAPSFRRHLLNAAQQNMDMRFQFRPLSLDSADHENLASALGIMLFAWNAKSRNVFHLSDDLRVMLQATSFSTATWGSVPWPFASFAITLEKPVSVATGEMIDTIIYARIEVHGYPVDYFCLLPVTLEKTSLLNQEEQEQILLLLRRGRVQKIVSKLRHRVDSLHKLHANPLILCQFANTTIEVSLESQPEKATYVGEISQLVDVETKASIREIGKLCAATALYISTLPTGIPKQNATQVNTVLPPAIKRGDPRLVSAPANVFRLTSTHTLSPDEKVEIEEAMARERTGMVVPHWRRGFFRRPSGLGNDPSAQRTIWVRPTFVNVQHLPESTLPGGALVKVKTSTKGK